MFNKEQLEKKSEFIFYCLFDERLSSAKYYGVFEKLSLFRLDMQEFKV